MPTCAGYGQKASVSARRLFFRSTSPLESAGCLLPWHNIAVLLQVLTGLPGILVPSDALREGSDCRGSQTTTLSGCPGLASISAKSRVESRSCFDLGFASLLLLPTAALPFLSVPRHVQVSSGRLTVVVALSCNRHFTVSRFPRVLSRLAFSPARLVPSRRHPWGSSLQRFDLVLSPVHLSVRRALLFLGRPHLRHTSHSLRFAAVRMVCRVSCRLRLEIRRSVKLRVGSVPLSRERLLQGAVEPCTSPSGNGFAGRRTSRVAPVDFANMLKSRSLQMLLRRVPYDG